MLRSSRWFLALCVLPAAFGCGGAERPAESASESKSADATASSDAAEAGEQSGEASSDGNRDGEDAGESRRATCDDGSCTPCGGALCPSGWYCDESAKGGPACGWLPECAKKPSCACVKRAFSGCSCEEQNGAAHVRCD